MWKVLFPVILVGASVSVALGSPAVSSTLERSEVTPAVVTEKISLGGQPCGVAGTPDAVWVSDYAGAALIRIDRASGERSTVAIPASPCELTYARGSLWVTTRSRVLVRVDPLTRRVVARIPVGIESDDVTAAAGSIWVANYRSATVTRVDPRTNKARRTLRIPIVRSGGVSGIAAAGGYVWVGQTQGTAVFRIDPRTNRVKKVETKRLGPAWLAGSGSLLWVSNIYDGTVMRLDPVSGRVRTTVETGATPVNLELLGDEVWVPNDVADTVLRIDARSGEILEVIPTAAGPAVVGRVDDEAWVTMFEAGEVWRITVPGP